MTEPLFKASSPVFTIDGQDRGELARDVVFLRIEEGVSGLKNLRARFVAIGPDNQGKNEQLLYMDGKILDFGKALTVAIGPLEGQRTIFEGKISALEISFDEGEEAEVCICAEDRLMDLRMTRRMRTYEEMTDADIAGEIANEHGLSPEVDVQGPVYDRIQQWNQSDLAFLRERARLLQAEVWVDDNNLHFKTRDKRDANDLTLIRGNDIIAVTASADLADQRTSVQVSGYDANNREVIDEIATADVVQAEISAGRTGPDILQSAFGERVSHRVREIPLEASEASDWARAEMLRRSRQFVTVNGITNGTPDLIVGSQLSIENMGEVFNGENYYVTQVCHVYDLASGHRTHFAAEKATIGGLI